MNDVLRSAPAVAPTPAAQAPALLFQRLRGRLLWNATRVLLEGSGLRLLTILFCSLLVWALVFVASWFGFHFLLQLRLGDVISIGFDLGFLALTLMLVFSGGIILYSSLFSGTETAFLLSTPVPADRVFAYQLQGAGSFSSWAFLLLGSPPLIAYGVIFHVPWYFYAFLPLFFLGFVLLPASLGALACLLVVTFAPRRPRQVLAGAIVLVLLLVGLVAFQTLRASRTDNWTNDAVRHVLTEFAFAQNALVPSHWLTQGLQGAAEGDLPEVLYRLGLLWSNGLFLYVLVTWVAGRLYRPGYNRVATGGSLRRRYGGLWLDQALGNLLLFLDPQTRLLIIKDFRTFRRDPAQWAQIVIFMLLLLGYFANTRRFYQADAWAYRNGVSLLNLAATSVLLCAWTGRFIYPLLSLEGRKFWILGLLPLRRERLLWGKFAFSSVIAVGLAEVLVVLSDLMLAMPPVALALHVLTAAVLGLGLSGLSVGMGASMPNFREADPSKIAVGFGGTLNVITSALFLGLVIGLMAAPWHLAVALGTADGIAPAMSWWLVLGVLAGLALGLAAVLLPLRLGARALRQMEF